jgi:Bacterial Ig-like domain (group 2)
MRSKLFSSFLVVAVLVTITACGGSNNSGGGTPPPPAITITVAPPTPQLTSGQTQQFTATVSNTTNTAVTWSIPSGAAGSISASGLYTAPSSVATQATVVVTATAQADTSKTATATVTLLADAVSVAPSTANAYPGDTVQFSASINGTASTAVTWSVSGSQGSIDANGKYTAPNPVTAPGPIQVTATSTADTTKAGSATLTVLQLAGLAVTPMGPTIAVNGTETFKATGTFTDGTNSSTADWSQHVAWTSAKSSVASIGSTTGIATGIALGVANIKATDTGDATKTATTALNVSAGTLGNGTMSGPYVFSVSHAGTRGEAFSAGVFTADGTTGQITGGVQSFNAPAATGKNVAISAGANCGTASPTVDSCYSVGADGRGTLHLTTASRGTDTYDLVIASDGSHGRLIFSGSTGVEVGTFEKQSATTLGDGSYSFLLGGVDGSAPTGSSNQFSEALTGQFTIASGNITSATTALDINDNGAINGLAACGSTCPPPGTALQFSASYAQASSNGRGTLVLTPTGIPSTQLNSGSWNFDYYVVSANKIVLIQTDVQATTLPTVAALTGIAEKQSFPASPSVSGNNFVFLVERSAAQGLFGSAGQWQFGATKVTGEFDANCLGTGCPGTTTLTSITPSDYTIDSTGRGTVTISAARSYVFFLIGDPSAAGARIYILETDNKPNAGVGTHQSASLSLPTVGTALAFDLAQLATNGNDSSYSGQLFVAGGATLTGIADSNVASNFVEAPGSVEVDGTTLALQGGGFGRGTVTLNVPNDSSPYAFYLISPTQMVIFGTNSALTGIQAVDGTMEVQ